MSLISKAISHLFGGVSQQPASLRDASQCDLMENCWPNVAEGLGKRPPVLHVAKLNSDTAANRKVHMVNRDEGEKYAVTLKSGEVKVYDRITGAEKSVAVPDGTAYLNSADPLNDFSLVTVADTTYIVNKSVVVEAVPYVPALPSYVTYANDFGVANGWTIEGWSYPWGSGSYENIAVDPNGGTTADVLKEYAFNPNPPYYGPGYLRKYMWEQNIPLLQLATYTVGAYVKMVEKGAATNVYGRVQFSASNGESASIYVNLETGAVVNLYPQAGGGQTSYTVSNAGNGWWKITATHTMVSTSILNNIQVGIAHNPGVMDYQEGSSIAVWGASFVAVGTTVGSRQWASIKLNSLPTNSTHCTSGGKFSVVVNGSTYETAVSSYSTLEEHATALSNLIRAGKPGMIVNVVGTDTVQVEADPLTVLTVTATAYDETDNGAACTGSVVNNARVSLTTGAGDPNTAAFFTITAAVPRQTYTVRLGALTVSYTVDADGVNAKTTTVANTLAWYINIAYGYGYHAVVIGSTVKVTSDSGGQPSITVTDSYGGQGMIGFTDSVTHERQLPTDFWEGYTLKVRGALDGGGDDYYVTYSGDSWTETAKPGIAHNIADGTMPHKLVRNSNGTFTFSKNTWLPRQAGDEESNPMPSFVGRKINNVFFHRERLGLLAGENIIMSRVADYYNMFAASATAQLDDDPIDVSAADVKVTYLYHALAFQDSLLVFSDAAQYQLTGGDVLSAATVRLEPTTRFRSGKSLPPTAAGRNVFFAVNKGEHSSLREYFVTPGNVASSDALDITSHVPAYVGKNLRTLEASSLTDCMMAVSSDNPNEAYVYKFMWNGETKVQSAWGKWVFDADASILAMGFDEATLSMVVLRSDGTYLEQVDLQTSRVETGMDRGVYLDRRVTLTGVYNAGTGRTTWTLPFADAGTWQVVKAGGWTTSAGTVLSVTKDSTTTVSALGDFSAFPCFVGKPYTMRYRFSEFFLKDGEKTSLLTGRLQLRTLTMGFSKTGYYRLEVTPKLRDTYSYPYTATLLGDIQSAWDTSPLMTGRHRFPTVGASTSLQLDLVNDTPLPCFFHGAEWEALYVQRAKRA